MQKLPNIVFFRWNSASSSSRPISYYTFGVWNSPNHVFLLVFWRWAFLKPCFLRVVRVVKIQGPIQAIWYSTFGHEKPGKYGGLATHQFQNLVFLRSSWFNIFQNPVFLRSSWPVSVSVAAAECVAAVADHFTEFGRKNTGFWTPDC